jgi:glyoxylase-like metal-dependent hydrolase (beta-lactamase superfamily II)
VRVGDLDVLPVFDGNIRLEPSEAYRLGASGDAPGRGADAADWAPHQGLLADDGMLEIALGGFLVRSAGHTVLIDAGVGPRPIGPFVGGKLQESLAAYGVTAIDVTDVVFTHLHFDHVGWATTDGDVVFPNATYRCDERDWEHFVTGAPESRDARKLRPVTDRLATWDRDATVLPGLDAMVAPGHTPGSTIVVVSDGSSRALLLGDVVHCPVELLDDEWAGIGDVDPELAKRTRVALAKEIEGTDVPVAAGHFPGLQFGRVLAAQGRRQWVV